MLLRLFAISPFLLFAISAYGGSFAEHKRIGDLAMRAALKNTNTNLLDFKKYGFEIVGDTELIVLHLRDGSPVTYGDLCGLAGDHGANPFDLITALSPGPDGLPLTGVAPGQIPRIEDQLRMQWADIAAGGMGVNPFEISFIKLADEDRSHFLVSASTYRRQLEWIDRGMLRVFLEAQAYADPNDTLALRTKWATLSSFALPAPAKHVVMHQLAILLINYANRTDESEQFIRRQYVRAAIVANAFADHYLQDCFAAGHHMVDRLLAKPFVEEPEEGLDIISSIAALEDKGTHDYYNRKGLQLGDIRLYGDGIYTEEQIARASKACEASLLTINGYETSNILRERDNHTIPAEKFAAGLQYAPTPLIAESYQSQKTFGRSINGAYLNIGLGTHVTPDVLRGWFYRAQVGFGYEAITSAKDDVGWHEGWLAILPNATLDVGDTHASSGNTLYASFYPLGIDLLFADIFLLGGGGGVTFSPPGIAIAGRVDAGLQLKMPSWTAGYRIIGTMSANPLAPPTYSLSLQCIGF